LEGVEGELEADLVVAFACAAVGDGEAVLLLCNCYLGAGDDWAGEGGAKEVDVLVDGVAGDGWVAELFDELT
jgi:hypothetical protein